MTPALAVAVICLSGPTLAVGAPAEPPALERVARSELASPLRENLAVPPVRLGGVEGFELVYRDPRFPSVLLRRQGAMYIASRQSGPVPNSRSFSTLPSDTVYFLGRPDEAMIAGVWPGAVERGDAQPAQRSAAPVVPSVHATPGPEPTLARGSGHVSAPRLCRAGARERRLEQLTARLLATIDAADEPRR